MPGYDKRHRLRLRDRCPHSEQHYSAGLPDRAGPGQSASYYCTEPAWRLISRTDFFVSTNIKVTCDTKHRSPFCWSDFNHFPDI